VGSRTGSIWRLVFLYNAWNAWAPRPPGTEQSHRRLSGLLASTPYGRLQNAARIGLAALAPSC